MTGVDSKATEHVGQSKLTNNKGHNKNKHHDRPYVNDFDLVESMPGAQCDCTGPQRAEFVARSKLLWEQEKKEQMEEQSRSRKREQLVAEKDMDQLVEMFPLLERTLLQSIYLELGLEQAIEQAMTLCANMELPTTGIEEDRETSAQQSSAASSSSTSSNTSAPAAAVDDKDFFSAEARKARKEGLVVTDNAESWPPLTDADGWQVFNPKAVAPELDDLAMDEEDGEDGEPSAKSKKWSSMAKAARDLPSPRRDSNKMSPSLDSKPLYGQVKERRGKSEEGSFGVDDQGYDYYVGHKDVVEDYDLARSRGAMRRDQKVLHGGKKTRKDSTSSTAAASSEEPSSLAEIDLDTV